MGRYAKTLLTVDPSGWQMMTRISRRPIFKIGDKVKLSPEFSSTSFGDYLRDKTYIIDEIRPVEYWDWLPFTQYVGLSGNDNDLFFNTIFQKG